MEWDAMPICSRVLGLERDAMLQLRGLLATPVAAPREQQLSRGRVTGVRSADAGVELDCAFVLRVGQQGCGRAAAQQLLAIA